MRLAPGDIIEIETDAGLAYAQVTHTHVAYPEVVRVIKGLYPERPGDLQSLANGPTAFVAMVPLANAIERGKLTARDVAAADIPEADKAFPTFKMPIHDKQGNIAYWWLWQGDGLEHSVENDASFENYPMREVPTLQSFLARIAQVGSVDA